MKTWSTWSRVGGLCLLVCLPATLYPCGDAFAGHYALAYWREWGKNENAGNHSIHVYVWNENGTPRANVPLYTSWGVHQGTTDADGYCQIAQYTDADRDVKIQDGAGSTSDVSPKFSTARYPDWGHYSHEVGFLYKTSAGNPAAFDLSMPCGTANPRDSNTSDAPHSGSLIYNSILCVNRETDAFALDTWSGSFAQTFVAPPGIDRISAVQFHGSIGGNTPFRWSVSVHEGGPTGPAIFSKSLPHDFYPFRTFLAFGVNDCPVTPGQTYAVRYTRVGGGGFNAYNCGNVYANGQFYHDDAAVGTRDLEGFVLGMTYGGAAATSTPTNTTPAGPTSTPTNTPPAGPTNTPTATRTPTPTLVQGVLLNASLDDNSTGVANHWQSWTQASSPSFLAETGFWRHTPSGQAQRWWSNGQPHDGGLRQTIGATPGNSYRFCTWLHHYNASGEGSTELQVGIDPTGGTDLANVVWSTPVLSGTEWVQLCVEVQATGNAITVYSRANAHAPAVGERSSFMDDATLETFAGPTPTPVPDLDGDGVADSVEGHPPAAGQSHRLLPDSDGDGLDDGTEDVNRNGQRDAGETGTRLRDTDGDHAWDGIEVLVLLTDPLNPAQPASIVDADGDGLPAGFDVLDNAADSDGDRYLDGYEAVQLGLGAAANALLKPSLGDLNKDAAVSNVDALIAQALFLGIVDPTQPVFQGDGFTNADPSLDGHISNVDALILQSFFLGTLAIIPLPGPAITPGGATSTPTPTNTTPPTATPTATSGGGQVILSVPFEAFNVVDWSIGHDLWLPYYDPAMSTSWMWPKHDGGDWAQLYWERGTQSRSGYSFELRIQTGASIRGNGAEWWFRGDTALPTDRDMVLEVWTNCSRISPDEYTDIVLAWSPGSDPVGLIQEYDRTSRRANVGGWALHTLSFRSHNNPAEGDRIGLLFAAASTQQPFVSGFFDDLVIRTVD